MKKLLHLGMGLLFFASCNQATQRYTQNSKEIESVKKLIANYNSKTYDTSMYADSSKTYYNTKDKAWSPSEAMNFHKEGDVNYRSREFLKDDQEYEQVVTDEGETWVNCWLDWKGTMAATGKEIIIPVHLTYQFIDGKIVREAGMWNPTEIVLELQKVARQKSMSVDEQTVLATINNVTKAWNVNDKESMFSNMVEKMIRKENGVAAINSTAEYGGFMDIYHTAMPDFKVVLDNSKIIGNKAYLNWTCTGTNTGNFMDNKPTGKKIKTHGFSVWTFDENGKAVQEDAFYDNLTVFQQLGYTMPSLQ